MKLKQPKLGGNAARRVSKEPDPKREYWTHHTRGPCHAWARADWLWCQGHVSKPFWAAALTKPGMSAYDLWMKEAVAAASWGDYFPDGPSPSGGWNPHAALPGTIWHPPADCIATPSPLVVEVRDWEALAPGWRIHATAAPAGDPRGRGEPDYITLGACVSGQPAPGGLNLRPAGIDDYFYSSSIPKPAPPLWVVDFGWYDGTYGTLTALGVDTLLRDWYWWDAGTYSKPGWFNEGPWK